MKTIKTATWLPGFTGFYGSLWDDDGAEEMEIEGINEIRKSKGLPPIDYDACEWDYQGYHHDLSKKIARVVECYLAQNEFVKACEFEKLSSPREYNFSNDAIHVEIILTPKNQKKIREYLAAHKADFEKYLMDHYTSYDGFFSSYSNDVDVWLNDDYLTHGHKLGAVLNFILAHHLKNEGERDSVDMWIFSNVPDNYLGATNYRELTEVN